MPLVQSQRISLGRIAGQFDLLAIPLLAALGTDDEPIAGEFQLHVLLADAGDFGQHQHVVLFLMNVEQRLPHIFGHHVARGRPVQVAEGLDLDFLLALVAQRRFHGKPVHAAEFSLRIEILEFSAVRELFAGFGQLTSLSIRPPSFPSTPPSLNPRLPAGSSAPGRRVSSVLCVFWHGNSLSSQMV